MFLLSTYREVYENYVNQLQELAKKLNVTNVYISLIENGKDKPSLKLVEKMADKLNFKLTINFDEWE